MNTPTYVVHDERRWRVIREEAVDKEPGYLLAGPANGASPFIWARVSECTPWKRQGPRRRIWRGEGVILEWDGRTMSVRKARTRKRYPTSLEAIYHMTVKAHLANERAKKLREKAQRR